MGVNSFSIFLKKYAPQSYFEFPLESLRGKRLAIDMGNLIFQMMGVATKEIVGRTNLAEAKPDLDAISRRALDMIIHRLEVFMYYGITPVCVFDAKPHPLKQHCRIKRRKQKDRIRQRLASAEQKLYSVDPMLRSSALTREYAKCLCQNLNMPKDFEAELKDILATVGFPILCVGHFDMMTTDAEGLCASLCLPGNDYCYAGVTTDSDFHAYGGNIAITEIFTKRITQDNLVSTHYYARVRSLQAILAQTMLSFDQFQDLCILMGTDFNANIPGIGPARSWKLIKDYGNIPNIIQQRPNLNTGILNYHNVKAMFMSPITAITNIQVDFDVAQFREHARNTFDLHNLRDHTSTISNLLEYFENKDKIEEKTEDKIEDKIEKEEENQSNKIEGKSENNVKGETIQILYS